MSAPRDADVLWRPVVVAYALSVLVTLVVGAALFFALEQSVWWLAAAGVLGLAAGGSLVGARRGRPDALGATLLAILYFATTIVVIVGGTFADVLPDPLPGLPIGDSTFFFVWPLTQLAGAVIGSAAGGRWRGSVSRVATWRPWTWRPRRDARGSK
ncbi:MAG: hypothetical protein HYY42_03000 [Chloroflexi bacterium]|nr:hypothetical protein [Chloroflexota bacterium]